MTIRAIYEHGILKLKRKLKLKEHQPVLVDIYLLEDDLPASAIARLARKSKSFGFLKNPAEDIYSLKDGKPLSR
jgi:predicted DNA-binding antitoxin AbrB/MazE fold protein